MRAAGKAICVQITLLSWATCAYSDGCYFPQQAYPLLPTIPVQQAIIVHRHGEETLIVESAFLSPSPDIAWVLPLPSEPTKIQLGEAGMLTSACMAMRPDITHDLHNLWLSPLLLWLAIIPFAWVAIAIPDRKHRRSRYGDIAVIEVLLFLFPSVFLQTLNTAGLAPDLPATSGVSLSSAQRLGDYDVSVLHANHAKALSQWLTDQSLRPLDAAAQSVVADYIARGWCFLVTRLHHGSADLAVPRPLIATFLATEPVFPMKLTALANTTTHVELCIVADQQAAAGGFHEVVADQFEPQASKDSPYGTPYYRLACFHAPQTGLVMGSPAVAAWMWDKCIVTKLVADLTPQTMSQDVSFSLGPLAPHRDHKYTYLSRRQIMLTILFFNMVLLTVLIAVIGRHAYGGVANMAPYQRLALMATALAALMVPGVVGLLLPTIPVMSVTGRSAWRWYRPQQLFNCAWGLAQDGLIHADMTPAAIPQLMVDRGTTSDFIRNPLTGQTMRPEASPGNFTLHARDGKLEFSVYDIDGAEYRTVLPEQDGK